jgi:hypothetical protein
MLFQVIAVTLFFYLLSGVCPLNLPQIILTREMLQLQMHGCGY